MTFDLKIVFGNVDIYTNNKNVKQLGFLFFLALLLLLTWSGPNIDVGTVFLSDFKCIAHNETDLYTCEIIVLYAMHWCENAYPSKCNF